MGRRSDSGRTRAEERAEAVLDHGAPVTAVELSELIHEVNPTGRDLPAAVAKHRYALKSRLQSLLVRRHVDELRITPSAFEDGTVTIVAIDHRYSGHDACHAPLDELDDDARARVRLVLDLAPHAASPEPAAAPTRTTRVPRRPGNALEVGRQALDEYDFERARTAFERAFEDTGGALEPALALLGLLVEQLALDTEALALEDALDTRAAADPRIRGLLALAAVRSGALDRGRLLLRAAVGPTFGDALAALMRAELADGDAEAAAATLGRLREADPVHGELVPLTAELAARRASARRPMEDALEQAVRAGDRDAIRARATELLQRFPDSAAAGKALRTLEAEAKARRFDELLAKIDEAIAADNEAATGFVEEARALFPADARLAERRSRVEADVRRREARRAIDEVLRQLASERPADQVAGLVAWMNLEAGPRDEVRGRATPHATALLAPLTGAELPSSGARRRALAEAALALGHAEAALERGRLEEAQSLVEGHPALQALPAARGIRQRIAKALEAREAARSKDRLAAALAAAERGEEAEAARVLATVERALLQADDGAAFDALTARVRAHEARETQLRHARALVAAGNFLAARTHVRRLADDENAPAPQRQEATALVATATRGVRRSFRVESVEPEGEEAALDHRRFRARSGSFLPSVGPQVVATDGGRAVWALDALPDQLLLREIDVDAKRVRRLLRVVPPHPLTYPCLVAGPGILWICCLQEAVCAIDPATGEVLTFHSDTLPRGGQAFITSAPDREHLWVMIAGHGQSAETTIVNLHEPKGRLLPGASAHSLVTGPEPAILVSRRGHSALHRPDGRASQTVPVAPNDELTVVVPHPANRGHVHLVNRLREGGDEERRVEVPAEGGRTLLLAKGRALFQASTSFDAGCLFIHYALVEEERRLRCVREVDGRLETVWDAALPGDLRGDTFARRAILTTPAAAGLQVEVLGPERPPAPAPAPPRAVPLLMAGPRCGVPRLHEAERRFKEFDGRAADRHALARALRESFTKDEGLKALDWLLANRSDYADLREKLVPPDRRMRRATFRLWQAHRAGEAEDWDGVLELLDADRSGALTDEDAGTASERTHAAHLHGAALARVGRLAEARDVFLAGAAIEADRKGGCHLQACAELTEALLASPGTPGSGWAGALVAAIRDHDHHARRGDAAAALAAIDVAAVHQSDELQSHARLAEALLRAAPTSDADRLLREHALRRFRSLKDSVFTDRMWLPFAWDRQWIDALGLRVEAEIVRIDKAWVEAFDREHG